ncbi:FecR domain-containing protein, partial [Comamonas sp. B-9]
RDRRVLQLAQGEIRLDVVHDAQRPLEVQTPLGRVRVLGTVFSVALRASGLQVSVAQGRVAVWGLHSDAAQAADVVLAAGEAARLDAQGGLHTGSVNRQDVGAWRDGWLVFDHTPLPEVLSRWNDYLERPLQLDPAGALQSLHLTG